MVLHLLHNFECVPSAAAVDDGYRVYRNAWHLLGVAKTSRPIPMKRWLLLEKENGYLPGYIISSWTSHPKIGFSNSHYFVEKVDGVGDWIIIGSYNLTDEIGMVKTIGEIYIHSLTTKEKSADELNEVKRSVPFENVYLEGNIAKVSWNAFSALQAPRELSILEKLDDATGNSEGRDGATWGAPSTVQRVQRRKRKQ